MWQLKVKVTSGFDPIFISSHERVDSGAWNIYPQQKMVPNYRPERITGLASLEHVQIDSREIEASTLGLRV